LNEDNLQKYVVVSIVTILLVLSALSGWAIMNYLKDDDQNDSFTITGTYSDNVGTYQCTGTASYVDLQESSRDYLYQFTFIISYIDGQGVICKTSLNSIFDIIKDTDQPNEELFEYIGETSIGDVTVSIWQNKDVSQGTYTYYLSGIDIVKIAIDDDGFILDAMNDDH